MSFFHTLSIGRLFEVVELYLNGSGIGVLPEFLNNSVRLKLLKELEGYEMVQAQHERGPRKVRQEYKACDHFPLNSHFLEVRDALEMELNGRDFSMFLPPNSAEPLRFTHQVVHRYEPGPLGIGPHRDGASYVNLVALLVLEGSGGLHSCEDENGRNPVPVPNKAGDLILIRGSGFEEYEHEPYHLVKDITEPRIVLAFRQKKK
jgi:hypothetical protein